jgi:hypothetical protein
MTQRRPWARATLEDYRRLGLRAHTLLADVPVLDVWSVTLPGRDPALTMHEVRGVFTGAMQSGSLGPAVRALFGMRRLLGRVFRWDAGARDPATWSFRARLTDRDRQSSTVEPGTLDGPFTVLYVHTSEAVSEIRNATVHGFLVWALAPAPDGHQLYWAVHVLPVGRWTRPYLALIGPFRRLLVYPSLLRRMHEAWCNRTARNPWPET